MFRVLLFLLLTSLPVRAEYVRVPVTSVRAFQEPAQKNDCGYDKVYYKVKGKVFYKVVKKCKVRDFKETAYLCCTIFKGKHVCKAYNEPVEYLEVWDDHGYPDR